MTKNHYIGNCTNSFDADGDCLIDELPWATVSDFACSDAEAVHIEEVEFMKEVEISDELAAIWRGHEVMYLVGSDDVLMLYDDTDDIHYFFGVRQAVRDATSPVIGITP
jgi:hypothetical protein